VILAQDVNHEVPRIGSVVVAEVATAPLEEFDVLAWKVVGEFEDFLDILRGNGDNGTLKGVLDGSNALEGVLDGNNGDRWPKEQRLLAATLIAI